MRTKHRRKSKFLGFVGFLMVLLLVLGNALAGSSRKWRANNHTVHDIKVFWTAWGCAGIKTNCAGGIAREVCKVKLLQPGESSDYKFDDGTSDRAKSACRIDNGDVNLVTTRDREKNGIFVRKGYVQWDNE